MGRLEISRLGYTKTLCAFSIKPNPRYTVSGGLCQEGHPAENKSQFVNAFLRKFHIGSVKARITKGHQQC